MGPPQEARERLRVHVYTSLVFSTIAPRLLLLHCCLFQKMSFAQPNQQLLLGDSSSLSLHGYSLRLPHPGYTQLLQPPDTASQMHSYDAVSLPLLLVLLLLVLLGRQRCHDCHDARGAHVHPATRAA